MMSVIPALDLLRNKNFVLIWIVTSIHQLTRRMELLVLGYLVFDLTNSTFQVGLIALFLNLPRPILALFAGIVTDRIELRRILIWANSAYSVLALFILLLLVTGTAHPFYVFAAILLQGSARVFDDPCRRVAIFDLVGHERIANAMSLETLNNNAGKIIGPFLGGVLIAGTGFVGAYVALTAFALTNLALILSLRLRARTGGAGTQSPVWQSLTEGVKQCWQNPIMFGVLCITLTVNGLVFPIQYFIPVIASDILSVGPVLGGVLGAAEGIGTLIGAVGLAMVRTIRRHGVIFVTGSLIAAAAVVLVSISPWFALSFTVLFLGGLGQAGFSTMQSTILLLAPPPEMRGRAMGAQGLAAGLGHLVGGSGVGAVAAFIGIGLALGLSSGTGLLLVLVIIALTPVARRQLTPPPSGTGFAG